MLIPLKSVRSPEEQKTFSPPIMTTVLIIVNVVVFIFELHHGIGRISAIYGAIPYELTHFKDIPPPSKYPVQFSLIASLFLHGGFLHIIGNMLYLNAFGPNVENKMGHFKYLLLYLLCGVGATLFYILFNINSRIPLIGASGAIAGVMGAHLVSSPGSKIKCLLLIFVISLPAIVVIIPWILIQIDYVYQGTRSNVAFVAHIGGFAIGMLLSKKFARKKGNDWYVNYRGYL